MVARATGTPGTWRALARQGVANWSGRGVWQPIFVVCESIERYDIASALNSAQVSLLGKPDEQLEVFSYAAKHFICACGGNLCVADVLQWRFDESADDAGQRSSDEFDDWGYSTEWSGCALF